MLQPFEPPNDRAEWQVYQPLSAPMPLRPVPRDAGRRLGALAEAAPAFAAPIAEIRRTLALAAHAGRLSPRLRPLLLVGAPGIGKTWFARRLAQALDLPFAGLNLGGATDNRCLQGTARGWSAATPAWPIAEMARLCVPNPLLFLDEVDKAGGQRENNGRAHDTLLAMIEPESAACWFDECLRTAADLRNVLWIMAANETRGIPAPLLVAAFRAPDRAAAGERLPHRAGRAPRRHRRRHRLRAGGPAGAGAGDGGGAAPLLRPPPQPAPAAGDGGGVPGRGGRSGAFGGEWGRRIGGRRGRCRGSSVPLRGMRRNAPRQAVLSGGLWRAVVPGLTTRGHALPAGDAGRAGPPLVQPPIGPRRPHHRFVHPHGERGPLRRQRACSRRQRAS